MSGLAGTWAVVVHWNSGEALVRCVASLVEAGLAAERVVVVDNGSTDGALERAVERAPGLCVLRNGRNLGFGVAANRGARHALDAGGETLVFVNDDAWFPPGELGPLVDLVLANPRVGMVGPRVLLPGEPPRVWAAGGLRRFGPNLTALRGNGAVDGPEWRRTVAVDYVPGCALVVRGETWARLGGFGDDWFAYMEDVELGVRARERGLEVLCVGERLCWHDASRSTGGGYSARRKYMNGLNSVRFLRGHGGALDWASFAVFDVACLPLTWLAGLPRGRARGALAKGVGIWDGLRGRTVRAETLERGKGWLW